MDPNEMTDGLPEQPDVAEIDAAIDTARIIEALGSCPREREPQLIDALTRRLDEGGAGATFLMDGRHRAILCRHMEYRPPQRGFHEYLPRYIRFVVAALEALRRLGEPDTVPVVERLAKSRVDPRIAEKASAVLEDLRERTRLLRPAGAGNPEPSERLLRPSEPEA